MPKPPPSRTRRRINFGALSLLAALFAFFSLGAVLQVTGSAAHDGESKSSEVFALIVFLVIMAIFTFAAVQARQTLRDGAGPNQPETKWHRRLRIWGNPDNPRSWYVALAFCGPWAIFFIVLGIIGVSNADKSHFVQHNGTRVNATVISVNNSDDCGSSDCLYQATVHASFEPAVAGANHTTVEAQEVQTRTRRTVHGTGRPT